MSNETKMFNITEELWDNIDIENRLVVEQYLDSLVAMSDSTYARYRTDVRQFVYWIHSSLYDKPLYEITMRDFERFLDVMRTNGNTINSIQSKKYGLCTFFNFVHDVIKKSDDRYADFKNDFKDAEIKTGIYNGKSYPITYEEYLLLIDYLRRDGYLLALAWVMFAYTTGANRLEYRKISSDVVKYPFPPNADYILSNTVERYSNRQTGEKYSINFKIRREVYDAMKAWVDSRGYDCDYVFSSRQHGVADAVTMTWANNLCVNTLSQILSRNVTASDFQKGYHEYIKQMKKIDKSNTRKQLTNLAKIELETEPINLVGYERDLKKIIDDL